MGHTPGPWRHNGRGAVVDLAGEELIIEMTMCASQYVEGNARLIAAAPELLEALQHLRDAVRVLAPGREAGSPIATSLRIAEAAIAKAEKKGEG